MAPVPLPPRPPLQPRRDETALDTAVRHEMRRAGVPGLSLAVTRHDRLLHAAGFGTADLRSGAPATAATRYLWFSLSKIATATAVVALADAGRLDLDAPVREFVAGYPSIPVPVQPTVRHLLSHTAAWRTPHPCAGSVLPTRRPLNRRTSSTGCCAATAAPGTRSAGRRTTPT
jgi:CubicO group peptidase (beta-lactamase class C family)